MAEQLGTKDYLTGTLSMADFIFFEMIETVLGICHDKRIFQEHPNLGTFHERMKAIP